MSLADTPVPPTSDPPVKPRKHSRFEPWVPKLLVCLEEGHVKKFLLQDIIAGLTVGVIALPLAIAFGIASHVTPERGLYTAIIAGVIVSFMGGSRVQIAGPTGAFVVIIAGIIDKYEAFGKGQGYQALAICTLMAGAILVIMGVFKFGGMIKFIPYPVTTGFTSGIALIIFSQQIKDFFGLGIDKLGLEKVPSEFAHQWGIYFLAIGKNFVNWWAAGVGIGSLLALMLLRRFAPRIPSYIVVVVAATLVVAIFGLDSKCGVPTIETKFGGANNPQAPSGIPQKLPTISLPTFDGLTFARVKELIPDATTIALLAAIESLLCAVVADGMIGGRHKSNLELIAQGTANIASVAFGGIPATGAIARTAANVKSGGKTPVAGIIHALVVMLVMLLAAPYAGKIPLAGLAAVLVMVAWNMSERDHFRHLFKAPRSDVAVLLTTFGLTVFTDLTIAVGIGMVLAAMLFMKRMSEVTNVGAFRDELEDYEVLGQSDPNAIDVRNIPAHTEVYEITGPFFFGVADRLKDTLNSLERPPKVFILRMRHVPAIDATGMRALEEFWIKCKRQGTQLILAGVHAQPMFALAKYELLDKIGEDNLLGNIDDSLNRARQILGIPPVEKPAMAEPEVARERTM